MRTVVRSKISTQLVSILQILLRKAHRQLNNRNTNSMSLLGYGINFIECIFHVPMFICTSENASAFDVACFFIKREDEQLINRNVNPALEGLNNTTFERIRYSARRRAKVARSITNLHWWRPHINAQRSTVDIHEPLFNIHRMSRRQFFPNNFALSPRVCRYVLAMSKHFFETITSKVNSAPAPS